MDPITINRLGQLRQQEILAQAAQACEDTSNHRGWLRLRVIAPIWNRVQNFTRPAHRRTGKYSIGYAKQEQQSCP